MKVGPLSKLDKKNTTLETFYNYDIILLIHFFLEQRGLICNEGWSDLNIKQLRAQSS